MKQNLEQANVSDRLWKSHKNLEIIAWIKHLLEIFLLIAHLLGSNLKCNVKWVADYGRETNRSWKKVCLSKVQNMKAFRFKEWSKINVEIRIEKRDNRIKYKVTCYYNIFPIMMIKTCITFVQHGNRMRNSHILERITVSAS